MRVLLQRVSEASVSINGKEKSRISKGVLILLGIESADSSDDIVWLCNKIVQMRIFPDEEGKMNCSLKDISGDILVVSQFTLHASTKKGNRPSFIKAAQPEEANWMYEEFIQTMEQILDKTVGSGEFGANMQVQLINDGPVTIWLDSKNKE